VQLVQLVNLDHEVKGDQLVQWVLLVFLDPMVLHLREVQQDQLVQQDPLDNPVILAFLVHKESQDNLVQLEKLVLLVYEVTLETQDLPVPLGLQDQQEREGLGVPLVSKEIVVTQAPLVPLADQVLKDQLDQMG
jgi:hypothetical protein